MSDDKQQAGSLAEEAAKLFKAVQDRLQEDGSDYTRAAAGAVSGIEGLLRDVDAHLATGGADCIYCPVCRAISLVRSTSPEVRSHFTSAASSLMRAVAELMATHVPDPPRSDRGQAPVEKIDLDDDAEWEDD